MKKYKELTSGQRYQIYGLKQAGLNQTRIAQKIGVDKSTISREFRRNKGQRGWQHKECVINIPTVEMAEKVVGCGNTSGADIDKFEMFCLTPKPAARVGTPLIDECYANLECRVADTRMVAKYCLFVVEVIKAWIDPAVKNPKTIHHIGSGNFMVAGEKIKLRSKMK